MTLLFPEDGHYQPLPQGPVTHAFVIGVGAYPDAKPGRGALDQLRTVPDLPSAADSAKFLCRWLLDNGDKLAAPLASLEVLISDVAPAPNRFDWGIATPIDRAVPQQIGTAGAAWLARLRARPGDVALFYWCGHGASLSTEPVVFLEDLNSDPLRPWSYVNLAGLGRALQQDTQIDHAILFADACGETVAAFQLSDAQDFRFFQSARFGVPNLPKVMLLTAAPQGLLAYDGPIPGSAVRLGRFTQTLVKALDGASIRQSNRGWAVNSSGLRDDLLDLRQFYFPAWNDQAFEPVAVMSFNRTHPVVYPRNPVVPVTVTTNPVEAMDRYSFCIHETNAPDLVNPTTPADLTRKIWRIAIPPRNTSVYAVAFNHTGFHGYPFTPNQPQFDLQVDVA